MCAPAGTFLTDEGVEIELLPADNRFAVAVF
jgi:hypothetical protein